MIPVLLSPLSSLPVPLMGVEETSKPHGAFFALFETVFPQGILPPLALPTEIPMSAVDAPRADLPSPDIVALAPVFPPLPLFADAQTVEQAFEESDVWNDVPDPTPPLPPSDPALTPPVSMDPPLGLWPGVSLSPVAQTVDPGVAWILPAYPAEIPPSGPVVPGNPAMDAASLVNAPQTAPDLKVVDSPVPAVDSKADRPTGERAELLAVAKPEVTVPVGLREHPLAEADGISTIPISQKTVSTTADEAVLPVLLLPMVKEPPLPRVSPAPSAGRQSETVLSAKTPVRAVSPILSSVSLSPLPAPVPAGVAESGLRMTMEEATLSPKLAADDAPVGLVLTPDATPPDLPQRLDQVSAVASAFTDAVPLPSVGQAEGPTPPVPAIVVLPAEHLQADTVGTPHAPETRASPLVAPLAPAAQIVTVLSQTAEGTIELILAPAELGRVRMELVPEGEILRITVAVERPETLDMLRRNADVLLVEIRQAGFTGAHLSFGSWGGQKSSDPAPGPQENPPAEDAAPGMPPPFFRPSPAASAAGAGLDLRL